MGNDPIEKYGNDLTELARQGKKRPGHWKRAMRSEGLPRSSQEEKRITPYLLENQVLGKTTVVEGLAKRIIEEDVPEILKREKRVIALDLTAMVAGAMYKGQFEERLNNFIKSVKKSDGEIIILLMRYI
ncbi:hypothetical protein Ct9H90mP29_15990 [bacterium]|nr:MAG: hypothetical protein Ct9H90mP29_15990 [bacterium]